MERAINQLHPNINERIARVLSGAHGLLDARFHCRNELARNCSTSDLVLKAETFSCLCRLHVDDVTLSSTWSRKRQEKVSALRTRSEVEQFLASSFLQWKRASRRPWAPESTRAILSLMLGWSWLMARSMRWILQRSLSRLRGLWPSRRPTGGPNRFSWNP